MIKPFEFVEAISSEFCRDLKSSFDRSKHKVRRDSNYSFFELLMVQEWNDPEYAHLMRLQNKLYAAAEEIKNIYVRTAKIQTFPKEYGFEAVRIKKYVAGDSFPWHVDVRDHASAKRFLVIMFYLNNDFVGGRTEFGNEEEIEFSFQPRQGNALIFPPLWTHPHRGCVIESGSKYIANVYFHYL